MVRDGELCSQIDWYNSCSVVCVGVKEVSGATEHQGKFQWKHRVSLQDIGYQTLYGELFGSIDSASSSIFMSNSSCTCTDLDATSLSFDNTAY